jgi:uncharacterized protein YlzI (FlbEa/FlbD family)
MIFQQSGVCRMIEITALNGEKKKLRSSCIQEMYCAPDTVLVMTGGNCMLVKESLDDIIRMIVNKPSFPGSQSMEVIV